MHLGMGDVRVESAVEDGEEEESEGVEGGEDCEEPELHRSVRSIRSFESMMSERGGKRKVQEARELGSGGYSSSSTMRTRTMGEEEFVRSAGAYVCVGWDQGKHLLSRWRLCRRLIYYLAGFALATTSRSTMPQASGWAWRVEPPTTRRFLECSADDLKIGEVAELLREHRRLVEDVRMAGGFSEEDRCIGMHDRYSNGIQLHSTSK